MRVRAGGERKPLTGTLEQIRSDFADLEAQGITEVFVDLNFDPEIGSPDADPARVDAAGRRGAGRARPVDHLTAPAQLTRRKPREIAL